MLKSDNIHHIITTFGLIRHGCTIWNEENRIQGQADSPLTDDGRCQVQNWGQRLARLPWNRILASDSGRVRETVQIINHTLQVPVTYDRNLREQDWGRWTGRLYASVEQAALAQVSGAVDSGWHFQPPGGESRQVVLARGETALKAAASRWPGQSILVVCHEGMIRCLIYRLLGRKYIPGEPKILKPNRLHILAHDQGRLRIEALNRLDLNPS